MQTIGLFSQFISSLPRSCTSPVGPSLNFTSTQGQKSGNRESQGILKIVWKVREIGLVFEIFLFFNIYFLF